MKGFFTDICIYLSIMLLPGMLLGALVGTMLVKKVDENNFRRMVLVLVIVSGFVSLIAGIISIL